MPLSIRNPGDAGNIHEFRLGKRRVMQDETTRRALVVDDATTIRLFHRSILEDSGFEVTEAMNGLEGLERALDAPAPPDLLVVDVNMPLLDGYAFLRAVRSEPALRGIPAIMISTERAESDSARGFAAGANLYLVKPVRPEVLARFARLLAGLPAEQAG